MTMMTIMMGVSVFGGGRVALRREFGVVSNVVAVGVSAGFVSSACIRGTALSFGLVRLTPA